MKTEKIAAALRCSSQVPGPELDCRTCPYHMEETVDGVDYDASPYAAAIERQAVGGGVTDAPDGTEKIYGDTGLTAEDAAALQKDWSDLCTVIGECGGLDRIKELAQMKADGRIAILPCKPDGVMLDMSDPERPELMKKLHFAVAYVRCGIVFHKPYKIFSENVAAGHIRPVSSSAEKMLGEEV